MSYVPFGPLRVYAWLGSSDVGELYVASGPSGEVVLKLLPPRLYQTAGDGAAERRLVCSLRHDNLVQLREVGLREGVRYVVMERVHGPTLRGIGQRARRLDVMLPDELVHCLSAQACEALLALHRAGLCHGDVCPSNLLCREDGVIKLIDIAEPVAGRLSLTGEPDEPPATERGDLRGLAAVAAGLLGMGRGGPWLGALLIGQVPPRSPWSPGEAAAYLRRHGLLSAGPTPRPIEQVEAQHRLLLNQAVGWQG